MISSVTINNQSIIMSPRVLLALVLVLVAAVTFGDCRGNGYFDDRAFASVHVSRDGRMQRLHTQTSGHSPLRSSSPSSTTPPSMTLNVYDYGAKGDGSTDDTTAFQKALDACGQQGGGQVWAPTGQYKFMGSLTVPPSCTLRGTYSAPPAHNIGQNPKERADGGSFLLPYGGHGSASGTPFVSVGENAAIVGFAIYYPQQATNSTPVPYPWCISLSGNNPAATDIELLNPYNGILAVGAGRHYIARIQGQPLNLGLFVDDCFDIGRIENIHWNPWFSDHPALMAWQLLHGVAFRFARTDWEYVFNTFAFGYAVGYHFTNSSKGAMNGNLLGIGADMMANCSVLVEHSQPEGILITNGEFTAFVAPSWAPTYMPSTQVIVAATNEGSVRFVNSAFWGPSYSNADVAGHGTVGFSDCTFSYWDVKKTGRASIVAHGPAPVMVNNCEFKMPGKQVELSASMDRAVIVGNIITGPLNITNPGVKNAQIGLNADQA